MARKLTADEVMARASAKAADIERRERLVALAGQVAMAAGHLRRGNSALAIATLDEVQTALDAERKRTPTTTPE